MKHLYSLLFLVLTALTLGCQNSTKTTKVKTPKEIITRYYSIKMEGNRAVRDTLKDCFSCNQGLVYDKKGKEIELRFYQGKSEAVYGIDRYVYEDGTQKTGSEYMERDTITTTYNYEYDQQDRLLYSRAYDAKTKEMLYGSQYEYDAQGNQFRTGNMNGKGKIYEYYRRIYNDKGIALQENIEDLQGNPTFQIKYEYRPQADSNWVEQLTYYDGELSEIRFKEKVYWE